LLIAARHHINQCPGVGLQNVTHSSQNHTRYSFSTSDLPLRGIGAGLSTPSSAQAETIICAATGRCSGPAAHAYPRSDARHSAAGNLSGWSAYDSGAKFDVG